MTDKITQALQARRFHTASRIVENSPAVLTNGHELEPAEIIPAWLAAELDENGDIHAFMLADTIEEAARLLDISETTEVFRRVVYNLDNGNSWEADRRIVGFNPLDPVRGSITEPRVDITPVALSTVQPAFPPAKALITVDGGVADVAETEGAVDVLILDLDDLAEELEESPRAITLTPDAISWLQRHRPDLWGRLQPFVTEAPHTLESEAAAAARAAGELARHLRLVGAAALTQTTPLAGDRYQVIVRHLNGAHTLPAASEQAPSIARTLNDSEINTILHALRSVQYNSLAGVPDSCNEGCDHFEESPRLDALQLEALCESITLDSLILVH